MIRTLITLAVCMMIASIATAQTSRPSPTQPSSIERLRAQERAELLAVEFAEAFDEGDLEQAEAILLEHAELDPSSFVVAYNLACVRSMRGDPAGALEHIRRTIQLGFSDVRQLQTDPNLETFRTHEAYMELVENWHRILDAQHEAWVKQTAGLFKRADEQRRDESLKITIRSSHDETLTDHAIAELQLLAAWAGESIFGWTEAEPNDAWAVVALPSYTEYQAWLIYTFGPQPAAGSTIGGIYDHDRKRLVAQDLGATLRHEFLHVLHWRDMTRRGQSHPIWIQEGLCSLAEDYDLVDGAVVATGSWRTNIVKRIAESGRLRPIAELAGLERNSFTSRRPLARYAEARTVFLYLAARGKLRAWYADYVDRYDTDPSGVASLEAVLGEPIDAIQRTYVEWVKSMPMVAEEGNDLEASMGLDLTNGRGDGVRVAGFLQSADRRRTGLRLGDTITAINGEPVRDLPELIRRLDGRHPGAAVLVGYRRGILHRETQFTLRPR